MTNFRFSLPPLVLLAWMAGGVPSQAAGDCVGQVSCQTPTAVTRGTQVPVWHVETCVIGPAEGPYTKIACDDPQAIHMSPTGNMSVCFVGTDGKVHWDFQQEVIVGRPFINHRIGGRWQPDWQSPPPYE